MLVRAKVNFSGKISMSAGDVKDIKDQYILNDLIRAGYIEPEAREAEIVEKPARKAEAISEKPVEISEKTSTKKKKSKK